MATVNTLVKAALIDLGVLAAGETPGYEDANDAMSALNRLVDQWAAERLRMYTITRGTWTISASDGEYTVGDGGDIDIDPRPVYLEDVKYLDTAQSPDLEIPLTKLTVDGWKSVSMKDDTATYPASWYYNNAFASGLATLYLFPIPTDTSLTGVIYYPAPISQFTALTSTVTLPPGYERMLIKELAIELAPAYAVQPSPLLIQQARDARGVVKRANTQMRDLSFDAGALVQSGGGYDIRFG